MNNSHVPHTEFAAFRSEMREHMQQQTQLMKQMVELQTKHSHLELQMSRQEARFDAFEARMRPLEAELHTTTEKTKYNRDLAWLALTVLVGIGAFAIKSGLGS